MRKGIAAFTDADDHLPALISIHDHGDDVCITLRGKRIRNDANGRDYPGPIAEIHMSWAEWRKMVVEAADYKR
ncbi:MAG: hypothetical protein ABSD31_20345 [Candidatus Binataceae bacterium]|jgi:hypothetical protein